MGGWKNPSRAYPCTKNVMDKVTSAQLADIKRTRTCTNLSFGSNYLCLFKEKTKIEREKKKKTHRLSQFHLLPTGKEEKEIVPSLKLPGYPHLGEMLGWSLFFT